jgi:hypothetical protein
MTDAISAGAATVTIPVKRAERPLDAAIPRAVTQACSRYGLYSLSTGGGCRHPYVRKSQN